VIGISRVFVITYEYEHSFLSHCRASNNELFERLFDALHQSYQIASRQRVLLLLLAALQLYRCIYRVHSKGGGAKDRRLPRGPRMYGISLSGRRPWAKIKLSDISLDRSRPENLRSEARS
jgi:hypothetical protein